MSISIKDAAGASQTVKGDVVSSEHVQLVKLDVGATGASSPVTSANPLPVSGPLTDTQLRATAVPVSGPLTDTQLRATAVPVSGTVTASGPLTDTQLRATAVPVSAPTLTKGTQSANGLSVQDLKDAGRTAVRFYAVAHASGTTTTETAITLTRSSGTASTTTGTSFVPTNGKTLRITEMIFATRGHSTATAQATTFNFRVNTSGSVGTTTTPVILSARCATPATANAWDRNTIIIPDGMEIVGDGTLQIGLTAAATFTTNAPTWDVLIVGFEY